MHQHLPDPHPGRCPNFRSDGQGGTNRCLRRADDHANKECRFPVKESQHTHGGQVYRQREPEPWVEP